MKKNLVIDTRWLRTGIGRYILNILAGLRQYQDGLLVRVLAREQDAERLAPLCDALTIVDLPIYSLREQLEIPRAARGAGLLHVPHYNAPLLFHGKLLVTVHDLIHISDPTFRRSPAAWMYARPMLSLVAFKACRIIAVSEYSKSQMVEHLRISPEKITVIHNGVGPAFRLLDKRESRTKVATELSLDRPFLLYVGSFKPHKNLVTLLRAFALLRSRKMSDQQFLIVGDDAKWKAQLVQECWRLGVERHVRFVSQVGDELLPWVYAAADICVLPSFIEGFGFPVVEAMACGTPVVCSRAAALPEVAGDAAEFFDPSSVEDLAEAIRRALGSSELRETLRRKGLARAKLFSRDECARRHFQLYHELLEV